MANGSPIGLLLALTYAATVASNEYIAVTIDTDASPKTLFVPLASAEIDTDASPKTFIGPRNFASLSGDDNGTTIAGGAQNATLR